VAFAVSAKEIWNFNISTLEHHILKCCASIPNNKPYLWVINSRIIKNRCFQAMKLISEYKSFCHSLNSTSNRVESDKVLSRTNPTLPTPPPVKMFFGTQHYFDPTRKTISEEEKKKTNLKKNKKRR
jgi:hypothetical protein